MKPKQIARHRKDKIVRRYNRGHFAAGNHVAALTQGGHTRTANTPRPLALAVAAALAGPPVIVFLLWLFST